MYPIHTEIEHLARVENSVVMAPTDVTIRLWAGYALTIHE